MNRGPPGLAWRLELSLQLEANLFSPLPIMANIEFCFHRPFENRELPPASYRAAGFPGNVRSGGKESENLGLSDPPMKTHFLPTLALDLPPWLLLIKTCV